MDITIEPWKKLIIHEIIEYKFDDWVEQLKGILHWSSVSFAIKEKFEKQIVKENATINLVDVSVNEIFNKLSIELKTQSKYANLESGKNQ